jgi:hypothetical protein
LLTTTQAPTLRDIVIHNVRVDEGKLSPDHNTLDDLK